MQNALEYSFHTPMSIDEMFAALDGFPGIPWGRRESEHFDRYLLGKTPDGVKVTIKKYDTGNSSMEIYFPSGAGAVPYTDDQKKAFTAQADEVLRRINALDVLMQ